MQLNLTTKPDIITRGKTIFVYLEKIGPFMKTAQAAWHEFWAVAGGHFDKSQITAMLDLSKIDETRKDGSGNIFQAGITLKSKPAKIPPGLRLREIESGKYACFVLTGSYSQLPEAFPKIFSWLPDLQLKMRNDFCISIYRNTPQDAPEDKLITEILIPV